MAKVLHFVTFPAPNGRDDLSLSYLIMPAYDGSLVPHFNSSVSFSFSLSEFARVSIYLPLHFQPILGFLQMCCYF